MGVGVFGQADVIVPGFVGDLFAQPFRFLKVFIFLGEFDLCQYQSGIGAFEDIDFPLMGAMLEGVALFFHDLVVAWHERGIVWHQIVRKCQGKVGQTPYESSPPKKVHKGQGAIQAKPKSAA